MYLHNVYQPHRGGSNKGLPWAEAQGVFEKNNEFIYYPAYQTQPTLCNLHPRPREFSSSPPQLEFLDPPLQPHNDPKHPNFLNATDRQLLSYPETRESRIWISTDSTAVQQILLVKSPIDQPYNT
ncbi:hypothetical protein AQUCO_01200136v1 [Aquilegia coerulea]|uniref:Uncharacterized protein n=1 Tax=Aquilegia coerulea TaxID=218851 RepID=A0A2G5E583_AQUCA|nr:hypothetical protein AQUCO_01200136v1 [Aquilegia coerulea]